MSCTHNKNPYAIPIEKTTLFKLQSQYSTLLKARKDKKRRVFQQQFQSLIYLNYIYRVIISSFCNAADKTIHAKIFIELISYISFPYNLDENVIFKAFMLIQHLKRNHYYHVFNNMQNTDRVSNLGNLPLFLLLLLFLHKFKVPHRSQSQRLPQARQPTPSFAQILEAYEQSYHCTLQIISYASILEHYNTVTSSLKIFQSPD
eukprot:TRINITY_DN3678_c1_g1_i8.p3 TRINITY_DN3678_c1_g1~~TRINITY_DN3678_c1_g1_i8.p3  ORF type:complete len:203 (+),score=-12.78 TRINITY_DN3678_c1_g1_i8:313-921(+)